MPLLPDQLGDFVTLTLNNFKKKSWVDLSLDKQHYVFAQKFLSGKTRTLCACLCPTIGQATSSRSVAGYVP